MNSWDWEHPLLYGWLLERSRWSEFNLSSDWLPERAGWASLSRSGIPALFPQEKISWSYVKAAVKLPNLPGIWKDSCLRGSNFCVLPFPKWNCRRVRGRDIVVGTLYASKSPEQNNCPSEGDHSSKRTFYELTILERSKGSQSLWANISHSGCDLSPTKIPSVNETVSTVSLGQLLVVNLAALRQQSCWRLFFLALSCPAILEKEN